MMANTYLSLLDMTMFFFRCWTPRTWRNSKYCYPLPLSLLPTLIHPSLALGTDSLLRQHPSLTIPASDAWG